MRSIGQNPTEDEILELIMEADLNGDGTISYNEFINMMRKKSMEQDQTEVGERLALFFIAHIVSHTISDIRFLAYTQSLFIYVSGFSNFFARPTYSVSFCFNSLLGND